MSMRYPGGLIATSPVNAAYPSGVWTQAQAIPYQSQNVWTRDQYWPYTTLLLQGNGTNGAQNNTFLDSSTNNFTVTRNGNTTQGSFTPYEANGYWSNYFDGSSILTFASSTNYIPGSGQFCLECWFFPTSTGDRWLIGNRNGNFVPFGINYAATTYPGTLLFYISSNGSSWDVVNGTTVPGVNANQWNHFALVRNSSNQFIVYINGVGTTIATNAANFTSAQPFYVGGSPSGGDADFIGYISNTRFVKGDSVYSGNFTPSTAPLTAITNTQLLTSQSSRFIDNSTNAVTPTLTGTPSVQAFQPFPGQTTYSTSVLGGSGYFDGSGDYLTFATNAAFSFGTGDFTIEFWTYTGDNSIVGGYSRNPLTIGEINFYIRIAVYHGGTDGSIVPYNVQTAANILSSTVVIKDNAWHHIAFVRESGTAKLWVDGIYQGSAALSTNFSNTTTNTIGALNSSALGPYNGYISNVRVVKGTAVYTGTSSITVPTSPVTAIANTSVLTNFTNAGISDAAMMNDLETVGNAQVSTSVVKYGTGSMAFDGTGDWLKANTGRIADFGTGDFTIEAWVYLIAHDGNQSTVFAGGINQTTYTQTNVNIDTNGTVNLNGNQPTSIAMSLNTWTHIAVSRAGGVSRIFINGVLGSSAANTTNYNGIGCFVGVRVGDTGDFGDLNGYIDDLRITKGAARYISSFTPPPARMPGQ